MFDWIKRALRPKQPVVDLYDQFVREFIAECQRQARIPKSYDHQARAFVFSHGDGREMRFQLNNIFATWLPQDQNGRTEAISRFVQAIAEGDKNSAILPEQLPSELMPGIRSRVLIGNTLLQSWIAGAPIDDSAETAWLPFAGDLAACVIRDQRYSMSQMSRANLAFADLPIDRAMSHAMTNFRARIPSPIFESLDHGVFSCSNLEDHQSALLFFAPGKDYVLPPIDGAPVALVPGRNNFCLTGSANLPGLTKLLDISARAKQMPNFCSSMLLQWDGDRWSEFHFDPDSANAGRQREIALTQLKIDYDFQKQLLDQYYQKLGLDIFIASFMLYQQKGSQAVVSVASLGSGTTGTLLPRADRLGLVKQIVDPTTGLAQKGASDIADVAWSEVMDIVGPLFEPVPYLYPPRFRTLGFPDADAWLRLKALSPTRLP